MSEDEPLVSVVMPTKNEVEFISESIDSILSQSYDNFEFIIIDGNSSDGTKDELKTISDNRVTVIYEDTPRGISNALNKGIEVSGGDYIARMDADDICAPDRFDQQVNVLNQHHKVAVVASWYTAIDRSGEEVLTHEIDPARSFSAECIMRKGQGFAHGSVMLRKSILTEIGSYRTEFDTAEDYDLWLRIAEKYGGESFYIIDNSLYSHRITADKLSHRNRQRIVSDFAEKSLIARRSGKVEPIPQLKQAIEGVNDRQFTSRRRDSMYYYLLGNEHLRSGKDNLASKYFIKSLVIDPWNIYPIYKLPLSQLSTKHRNMVKNVIQTFINRYNRFRTNLAQWYHN